MYVHVYMDLLYIHVHWTVGHENNYLFGISIYAHVYTCTWTYVLYIARLWAMRTTACLYAWHALVKYKCVNFRGHFALQFILNSLY